LCRELRRQVEENGASQAPFLIHAGLGLGLLWVLKQMSDSQWVDKVKELEEKNIHST